MDVSGQFKFPFLKDVVAFEKQISINKKIG